MDFTKRQWELLVDNNHSYLTIRRRGNFIMLQSAEWRQSSIFAGDLLPLIDAGILSVVNDTTLEITEYGLQRITLHKL